MKFDRGFGKRKIRRQKLYFFSFGHFGSKQVEKSKQCPKIDVLSQDDAFNLKKVGGVGRIDLIVPEASRNGKIFPWDVRCIGEHSCRDRGPLASEDQTSRSFTVIGITPALRSSCPSLFVGLRHLG